MAALFVQPGVPDQNLSSELSEERFKKLYKAEPCPSPAVEVLLVLNSSPNPWHSMQNTAVPSCAYLFVLLCICILIKTDTSTQHYRQQSFAHLITCFITQRYGHFCGAAGVRWCIFVRKCSALCPSLSIEVLLLSTPVINTNFFTWFRLCTEG